MTVFAFDISGRALGLAGKFQSARADDEMNVAFQITAEGVKNLGIAGRKPCSLQKERSVWELAEKTASRRTFFWSNIAKLGRNRKNNVGMRTIGKQPVLGMRQVSWGWSGQAY